MFFSKNIFYACSLLIFPVLIVVSWINVFLGNANYSPVNYALTFVLPALVIAYGISLLAAKNLHQQYGFTYKRVFFTLFLLFDALWLYAYFAGLIGLKTQFITAIIPAVSTPDPREIGSKFYSFQLILAMITIVIFYSISIFLFSDKKKVKVAKKKESKEEVKETT